MSFKILGVGEDGIGKDNSSKLRSGNDQGKNREEILLELAKENEFLQSALNDANSELNAKVKYSVSFI